MSGAAASSAVVAVWTLVSRITGLARVVVAGAVLGPTFLANILLSTNIVPNLVYTTVAGPVLGMVVVPAAVRALSEGDDRAGRENAVRLLSRITGYLLAIAAVVVVALVVVSPGLAWVLTAGVPDPAARHRGLLLTLLVLVLVAPQVALYTLAGVGAAAQQVQGRFALAAAAPAVENLGLIITLGVVLMTQPTDVDTDTVPLGLVITFGVGSTIAVALHAATQLWGAARAGMPVRPRLRGWRGEPVAVETARRIRASLPVAVNPAAAHFVRMAVAATVPGGVFVLQAAWSIYNVPSALGSKAVSSAALPGLSRAAAAGDAPGFARAWRQSAGYVGVVGLPSMALMIAFALPVADVLSAGKLQSREIITSFAAAIAVFGVAQLAGGAHEIVRQALFARLEVTAARRASLCYLAVTAASAVASLLLPVGLPRMVALCSTVLLADLSAALFVAAALRAVIAPERFLDWRRQLVAPVATVAMVPALVAGALLAARPGLGIVALVVLVGAAGAVGLGCYVVVLRIGLRRDDRRAGPGAGDTTSGPRDPSARAVPRG